MSTPALTLTDAAAGRIRELMDKASDGMIGLRIAVKARGCSGLSYDIQYASEKLKFDEVVEDKGVTVLIDPAAVMFLIGSTMDYQDDKFHTGFTFTNPNEKGRCGCGESFHV
ncbi:iron-sulfur cluster assembly protein [Azospirillum fermentarium]|uniref:HesB/IscA family protein n=1 Tax=Azospirillum fermentarium TaxID=1233114 RepID=UPI002226D81E|nr:iron-sulfur cluster assembly accessory protein [Azospirillum fermentarium]MCW2246411.1 iron-sulfur cluster assembly protein [Azospirillum fermentarium]